MSRKGTIYTYSIIYSAAEAFKDKTPYVVAVVEEDGARRLARVEGYTAQTQVEIGMTVNFLAIDEQGNTIYSFR